MKNHYRNFKSRNLLIILSTFLLFVFEANSQSFQVKWGMDQTLAGVSSHANFTPKDAALLGGTNTYSLASIYSFDDAIGYAYVVRPWPAAFNTGRSMDFTFSANQYEYHINSFSFRLRRSDTGPKQIKIRSSADNFASDLYTMTLTAKDKFFPVTIPLSFLNLANTTFSFRIYAFDASNTSLGVLWFDEVIINGLVTHFILPVDLTYFNAELSGQNVNLNWETAWEKNSKDFVIERSTNLVEFIPIGTLEAAGEAEGRLAYRFMDEAPLSGAGYYRLKMNDKDGNYKYSKSIGIFSNFNTQPIVISPNPASAGQIRIRRDNIDLHSLILTNILGQNIPFILADSEVDFVSLLPQIALSPGIYVLSSLQNGRKHHAKVLVP